MGQQIGHHILCRVPGAGGNSVGERQWTGRPDAAPGVRTIVVDGGLVEQEPTVFLDGPFLEPRHGHIFGRLPVTAHAGLDLLESMYFEHRLTSTRPGAGRRVPTSSRVERLPKTVVLNPDGCSGWCAGFAATLRR